ncbi:cell surface glycoprotein 1-like [Eriocheir sinensis]|uniref:cell surface glycoprotein 1-like n=1 Tax=Eriocheir sinensis TaxID=95602 RepID=UPI0021C8E8F2|nr:cell surface glycoprotein 1-like [Eriocheir sinensis]
MRREVILLVAGLAAVAALPVQESAAQTQQDDLLQILLGVDPEDNDLFAENFDKVPESRGGQALHEEVVEEQPQQQTELQDPVQDQTPPEDPPMEQKLAPEQDILDEQKQTQPQDSPEELKQAEPQNPPQEQTQLQPQVHEEEPGQDSPLPDGTEDESPGEESMLDTTDVQPEPQPIQVDTEEDLPIGPGDLDGEEATYFGHEMEGLPIEPDDDYVVLHVEEETPSQDMEGTFTYGLLNENAPFDQSVPSGPESQMQPLSVQLQPLIDSLSHDSEVPLSPEEQLPYDPQTELDYEQLPHGMEDGPNPEYDSEFPAETYQPNNEEDTQLEPESVPADDSYYSDHADVPSDLLSWLVPDFFDEEPTDYNESHYDSGYYDDEQAIEDQPPNKPEALFEPQESDGGKWEEPPTSEVDDATHFVDDSFLGNEGDVVMVEAVPRDTVDSRGRDDTDDVSLVDFFIPYDDSIYSRDPQEYSSDTNPEEDEQYVSPDKEIFPVDDGLTLVDSFVNTDLVELEQDQPSLGEVLSENNPFEDGRYSDQWFTEDDMAGRREMPEGDEAVTILETQPIHIVDVESDVSYPSLLDILEKDTTAVEPAEPRRNEKSLMIGFTPEADTMVDDSLPMERDYLTEDPDDDNMEIIMINDPRENFDNFPATPLEDGSYNTQKQPTPMVWYPEDHHQPPYWPTFRSSDRPITKVYYSVVDEVPRKKFPGFFGSMNDLKFSSPLSNRPHQRAVTGDPFSFMNEIPDDEMPPQFLASLSTSGQQRFRGLDSLFPARNYPTMFTTPRLSFRDLIQGLNPDYYNTMHVNNIQRQSPQYYPQPINPFIQYNGHPQEYSHTSPPLPYSSPFDSFQDDDYMVEENYYPNRLERLSSYNPNNMPSGIFREDTMPEMYPRGPQRYYEDYTTDLPFMSSYSYGRSRSLFNDYERPQYEGNSPSYNRPHYPQNSHYSTGPYHPTPIYSRYAPKYYGM